MTTPSSSYYENIIRSNPAYILQYRQHRWRFFYRSGNISSFIWKHSTDIFTFSKSCLTVQKAPVHPSWQVPASYHRPVTISLTARQKAEVRKALASIPFSRLKTDPCSFVNLMGDYMISEDLVCYLPFGFSYRFASQSPCEALQPLLQVLEQIAAGSPDYAEICRMEKHLFSWHRWEQLQKTDKKGS